MLGIDLHYKKLAKAFTSPVGLNCSGDVKSLSYSLVPSKGPYAIIQCKRFVINLVLKSEIKSLTGHG